jgi:predicted O-methyltransferase YrrM
MSNIQTPIDDRLAGYIRQVSLREPDVLRRLREVTASLPNASMQLSPEQGQFLALLVKLINARNTIEIGVFTGYSSTVVALALPAEGKITACDVSAEYTAIARQFWAEAGVAHKIELRLAPATETLDALIAAGHQGQFDFAFIDADKVNYQRYVDRSLVLLRTGGLIAIDNVLWHGKVIDLSVNDPDTVAIRALNERLLHDERADLSLVTIGDGLTLLRKR